ncbi:G protein-regulated inducer of neurite outgrowth 1 [Tupaia chinensis]|uniref:G protein-regulated inducer of neurite outgrowth 1 n=1 Tax=Tupaia chinensis TaxID=246437 RepID=UPI0003C8F6EA|nr:G protein-regulated inducer of neurite outgrowth 1 [Tupaia chinensis]
MGGAEDPAWLQLLRKDSSPPGPRATAICHPQDGSLAAGDPAMRDYCLSQQQASRASPRQPPDQHPGMASGHGSPSGAGPGASCSEGAGGNLAHSSPTCVSPQQATKGTLGAHGALVSGTPGTTLSGKSEPASLVRTEPMPSVSRNPMLLEEGPRASRQAYSTPTGQEGAGAAGEVDPLTFPVETGPAVLERDSLGTLALDATYSSKVETWSPRKEDPGSLTKVDPVFLTKEEPGYSGRENPVSSAKVDPASVGKGEPGGLGKDGAVSLGSTESASKKHTDPGLLGELTPELSSKTEPTSSRTGAPGCAGRADPASTGSAETVSAAKGDSRLLGKGGSASSGDGGPVSPRTTTVSAGQAGPGFPGGTDPTPLKTVDLVSSGKADAVSLGKTDPVSSGRPESLSPGQAHVSVGKTETVSLGKEDALSSGRADPMAPGRGKTFSSRDLNPEPSGKTDPVCSSGTAGSLPTLKAVAVPGARGASLTTEVAGPAASGTAEPLALGKADPTGSGEVETGPSGEAGSTSLEKAAAPTTSGKTALASLGKADPKSPRKADAAPEGEGDPAGSLLGPGAPGKAERSEGKAGTAPPGPEGAASAGRTAAAEKVDLGSSGKAHPVASGKGQPVSSEKADSTSPRRAESPSPGRVAALTLEKATPASSSTQSDGKPCDPAGTPEGARSLMDHRQPEPALNTEASGLGPRDPVASASEGRPHPEDAAHPPMGEVPSVCDSLHRVGGL